MPPSGGVSGPSGTANPREDTSDGGQVGRPISPIQTTSAIAAEVIRLDDDETKPVGRDEGFSPLVIEAALLASQNATDGGS